MSDPVQQYNQEFSDREARRQERHDRAAVVTKARMRNLTHENVAETLRRLADDDVWCSAIAAALNRNVLSGVGPLLEAQVENDVYEQALTELEAGRE